MNEIENRVREAIEATEYILDDAYETGNEEYIKQAQELLEGQLRILKKWREING